MSKKVNNMGKALLMGTALVSLNGIASEMAAAATGAGAMSAEVLAPIVITPVTTLHFGSLTVAAGTAGTVTLPTVTPALSRSAGGAGGVTLVSGAATPVAGDMQVVSAGGVNLQASVVGGAATAGTTAITLTDGTNTMEVFDFDVDLNGSEDTAIGNVLAIPTAATTVNVTVGAKLNVDAAQVANTYTGSYTLNVIYN